MTPEERKRFVEAAIAHTEERDPDFFARSIEESLEGRIDQPQVIVVPHGSSSPIVLEKRPFYDPRDRR